MPDADTPTRGTHHVIKNRGGDIFGLVVPDHILNCHILGIVPVLDTTHRDSEHFGRPRGNQRGRTLLKH